MHGLVQLHPYNQTWGVGALGFEPRSAGLEPAVLPGYTIPPKDGQTTDLRYIKRAVSNLGEDSLLLLAARTLTATELLLAPLPPLLAMLFPRTRASLHGERAGVTPPIYENDGNGLAFAWSEGWRAIQDSNPCYRLRRPV